MCLWPVALAAIPNAIPNALKGLGPSCTVVCHMHMTAHLLTAGAPALAASRPAAVQ
jgi:hypothetical protein